MWDKPFSEDNLKEGIKGFAPETRALLFQKLKGGCSGVFAAEDFADLVKHGDHPKDKLLDQFLELASQFSKPVFSNFKVGAVVVGGSGNLYFGTNLEFPGLPFGYSVHAEQSSLVMALQQESKIRAIHINHPPCGHCCQFMLELALDHGFEIRVVNQAPMALGDLIPLAFSPADLGQKPWGGRQSHQLKLINPLAAGDACVEGAKTAAEWSHAPYSGQWAGIGLLLDDGSVYRGPAIENAAFNPTLGPMQAALVSLVLDGKSPARIKRAVLVAPENSGLDYGPYSQQIMTSLGLDVSIETWVAK